MATDKQSGVVSAGLYSAFRVNGAPTYYGENITPWRADILEAGFIFAGCILTIALFSMLPGIHGKSRWFTCIWMGLGVFVGTVILVTNFSTDWESSEILTTTKYKAGTGKDIKAKIGIHIGLRGINVTLKGDPVQQLNETINYNEHFSWSWRQGRIGFGPFASTFNKEYRAAQFRGLPLPILWVAEYFTLDGEGVRWGRFYREAGLYSHMCLWLALALWILANIVLFMLVRYSAYLMVLTGISMCTASLIKHCIRNPLELHIPFSADHVLIVQYSVAFWLCLITGISCIVCGLVVLVVDLRLPAATASFFGMSILQEENFLQKESTHLSNISGATEASTSTNDSDLTEIVEVGSNGQVVRKIDVRPAGAPKSCSNTKQYVKRKDDVRLHDVPAYNEWTDTESSESDLDPTDDEWEELKPVSARQPKSRGFIQRFQVRRRIPSARKTGVDKSHVATKWRLPLRNRKITVDTTDPPRWR